MNIGVLGLGKLGLPLACVYAAAGHDVWVWDSSDRVRDTFMREVFINSEPGMTELLHQVKTRQHIELCSPVVMGSTCDVVFVVVPTPSLPTGEFSDEHVRKAVASLCSSTDERGYLTIDRPEDRPLHVVIVSTVSPGTCEHLVADLPPNIHLSYAPTFIALGEVLHHLTMPTAQLIGAENSNEARYVEHVIRTVAPGATYRRMSLVSAELGKITFNAYMTLKIVFSNVVGQMCDTYDGADIDDVLDVISLDQRISGPLSTAGGAYGGPCLPRDNRAFARAAGLIDTLAAHVHELNTAHTRYIAALAAEGSTSFTYSVLGTSYKDGIEYRIESFGDELDEILEHLGGEKVNDTLDADVVVIAMPLRSLDLRDSVSSEARVIDVWRTHGYLSNHVKDYVAFGRPR